SFDLDDTLVLYGDGRPRESCGIPWLLRSWLRDPLRAGSRDLLQRLHDRGIEIWVYTTSWRSEFSIRVWWRLNRLPPLGGVVNQGRHEQGMRSLGLARPPTKLPGHWGIDVHFDDSDGVRQEQATHSVVRIVVISPDDENWTRRVMDAVDQELESRGLRR
ncbi:MAG: hypothetical protein JNG89_12990, partial [Planctomycetaceae bacterium]|nr:hypothetical protein [Planctomycetaceae bacterium]